MSRPFSWQTAGARPLPCRDTHKNKARHGKPPRLLRGNRGGGAGGIYFRATGVQVTPASAGVPEALAAVWMLK